jgi:type I restriction enzyme, S subunit
VSDLPEGWTEQALGSIADCRLGKMLDAEKNQGVLRPYLRNTNVQWGTIDLSDVKQMRIGDEERDRYAVLPGDLLVCEGGEPGRCAVWRDAREMYIQKALHRVRPLNGTSVEYLRWFLQHATTRGAIENLYTGSTIKHLPGRQLARIMVPTPPVDEQRRIAAWLDEIESRRASIAGRLAAARTIDDRLRAAVLAAACSGRLTADWREEHPEERGTDMTAAADRRRGENRRFAVPTLNPHTSNADLPGTWRQAPLGVLLADLRYGTSKRSAYETDGMPVLRIPNVSAGVITTADLKFADLGDREADTLKLRDDDLLMIRSNGSVGLVGMTAAVTKDAVGMAYAGYLIRLRVDAEFLIPRYLVLALASPDIRQQIELPARSTSGVHNINSREVRALVLGVPSLAEQREIVRRAGAALGTADRLAEAIASADVALGGAIRGAISKAFQGELAIRRSVEESTSR